MYISLMIYLSVNTLFIWTYVNLFSCKVYLLCDSGVQGVLRDVLQSTVPPLGRVPTSAIFTGSAAL